MSQLPPSNYIGDPLTTEYSTKYVYWPISPSTAKFYHTFQVSYSQFSYCLLDPHWSHSPEIGVKTWTYCRRDRLKFGERASQLRKPLQLNVRQTSHLLAEL